MNQVYIMYAISEYRGYNSTYISRKLHMEYMAFKTCIDSIKKYVKIYKDNLDKRARYPALTKKGANFLRKIMPKIIEIEKIIGGEAQGKELFIKFIHTVSTEAARYTLKLKKEKFNEKPKN